MIETATPTARSGSITAVTVSDGVTVAVKDPVTEAVRGSQTAHLAVGTVTLNPPRIRYDGPHGHY